MKNFTFLLIIFLSQFAFSQEKLKIITNDGIEHNGYFFPFENDLKKMTEDDVFKIQLHELPKIKSNKSLYSRDNIKNIFRYYGKKNNLEEEWTFAKLDDEMFDLINKEAHKRNKNLVLKKEDAWKPIFIIKKGKDLDLACYFRDVESGDMLIDHPSYMDISTDYFIVEHKNNTIHYLFTDIEGVKLYKNDPYLKKNTVKIFLNYCPKLVEEIYNGSINVGLDANKIFDYYLKNCN